MCYHSVKSLGFIENSLNTTLNFLFGAVLTDSFYFYGAVLTENWGRFDRKWGRFGLGPFWLVTHYISCVVVCFQCVVQSYLQWLQDSDYSPNCSLCSKDLSQASNGECVRLTCYGKYIFVLLILIVVKNRLTYSLITFRTLS